MAITFALGGTAVVFLFLRSEHPRLDAEWPSLLAYLALFGLLTAAAGASFYGAVARREWRRAALGGLALVLALLTWYVAV